MTTPLHITVNIQNVHIHVTMAEEVLPSPQEVAKAILDGVTDEPAATAAAPVGVEDAAPAAAVDSGKSSESAEHHEQPPAEQQPKGKRGRPRKCVLTDEELLAQAAEMVTTAAPQDGETEQQTTVEDHAPEADANAVPIDPSTGEVLTPIAPDDPAIEILRATLRAVNYDTATALQFLTDFTGRTISRLGELTTVEVTDATAEISQLLTAPQA